MVLNRHGKAAPICAALALAVALLAGGCASPHTAGAQGGAATASAVQTSGSQAACPDAGTSACASTSSAGAATYQEYHNDMHGFSLPYPSNLTADGAGDENGQAFASADGSVHLTATGAHNTQGYKPDAYLVQVALPALAGKIVLDSGANPGGYTLSWQDGNTLGYQKALITGQCIDTYTLTYPAARKAEFQKVIYYLDDHFSVTTAAKCH